MVLMILQLEKKFSCKLRRHFHQEMFLLLMNSSLHKFLRNVDNRELLILFISTSNVVFTSNTFLCNFFHRHLCKTDTVMIQFSQQEKYPKLYNYLMKPMNLSYYTFEVTITREQLSTYIIHYTLNFSYR